MKKKQLIGLIVAVLCFVFVGATNVLVHNVANSDAFAALSDLDSPIGEYIGIINVSGTIMPNDSSSSSLFGTVGYDHNFLMNSVQEMMDDPLNVGIFLNLDTPGGTVYEADELYLKLMEYKEVTGRPIYAYMNSYAASGGYYLAMAADEIYANRNTVTGSIGVIMSTYNMSALYEKLGIKEVNIASGENKAMGSSGSAMTDEQLAIYQTYVDETYEQFVDVIEKGRGMDEATVKALADGRIYTAKQALDLDLIDGICGAEEYRKMVLEKFDESVTYYEPKNKVRSYFSIFMSEVASILPKSDTQVLKELAESTESGVLMYYAK